MNFYLNVCFLWFYKDFCKYFIYRFELKSGKLVYFVWWIIEIIIGKKCLSRFYLRVNCILIVDRFKLFGFICYSLRGLFLKIWNSIYSEKSWLYVFLLILKVKYFLMILSV